MKGNRIELRKGKITFLSNIHVSGSGNVLDCSADLYHTGIIIEGDNNELIIEDSVRFFKSTIFVKGDNLFLHIGSGSSFNSNCWVVCMGQGNTLEIGEGCMMADNVDIWNSDSHPIFNEQGEVINPSLPIKIGKHVWLGKWSKVLKGVTIGDNAIIGMGSIVTKDIPASSINVGTPAKTIRSGVNWIRKHTTY